LPKKGFDKHQGKGIEKSGKKKLLRRLARYREKIKRERDCQGSVIILPIEAKKKAR